MQCDVRKYELTNGSSMFCAWVSRLGQKGALFQTVDLQQSEASFGEVSRTSSALLCCIQVIFYLESNFYLLSCLTIIKSKILTKI